MRISHGSFLALSQSMRRSPLLFAGTINSKIAVLIAIIASRLAIFISKDFRIKPSDIQHAAAATKMTPTSFSGVVMGPSLSSSSWITFLPFGISPISGLKST